MAYLLGLIYADGTIKDVRISSRTCYIAVSSNDLDLLEQVRKVLSSTHKIYTRKSRMVKFSDHKIYKCSTSYILRVGNKMIYQDLVNLGLTPRKSLKIQLPDVPVEYFNFFLRGYFDGDGSLYVTKNRSAKCGKSWGLNLLGSRTLLESFVNWTCSQGLLGSRPTLHRTRPNSKTFEVKIRKKSEVYNVAKTLYEGSTVYLDRKMERYLQLKKACSANSAQLLLFNSTER